MSKRSCFQAGRTSSPSWSKKKAKRFPCTKATKIRWGDAFFVYANQGDDLAAVSSQIDMIPGVASVAYGGGSVRSLVDLLAQVRVIAGAGILLLLLLSFYLIYNTIRTTIYSRSDDIIIMRQVGAETRL